jgi:O-antigen/teichoic acid export membrane protein
MGSNDFGFYYYIITLIVTLVIFTKYGFDLLLIRFIPKFLAEKRLNQLKGILIYTNTSCIKNSIYVIAVFLAIIFLLNEISPIKSIFLYLIGISLLPFLTLLQINQAKLNGFKEIVLSQLPERIILPVFIIICVYFYTELFANELKAVSMLYIHLFVLVCVFMISKLFLYHTTKRFSKIAEPEFRTKYWKSISTHLIVITAGYMILTNIDVLMIGVILDKELSGVYGIASRISIFIAFGLFAMNTILAPQISKLYTEKKMNTLKSLLFKTSRLNLLISSLLFLLIVYFNHEVLNLFGVKYSEGAVALIILCAGQIINISTGSVGILMTMTGLEAITAKIIIFSIVLNIILNITLIPYLSIEGAAIATAITVAVSNLLMLYYSYRETGINASPIRLVKWNV